jgi:membrane protein
MQDRTAAWPALIKETISKWQSDEAPRMGASLAYYAVFSMAPLLVIVIAIIGFIYKGDTVGEIQHQMESLIGPAPAKTIAEAIHNADTFGHGGIAAIISVIILMLGAAGVFSELHTTMNKIWKAAPRKYSIIVGILREKLVSFAMVVGVAFLLLVSMIISAVLSAIIKYFSRLVPSASPIWHLGDFAISLCVVSLLFAALFRYVPDAYVAWHDVWVGAIATALLFDLGKFGIGMYLGHSGIGSTFGAAGSVVVILAWVYYSSQLVFLGAEFTYIYASRRGSRAFSEPHEQLAA